ncbi:hydroxyacid dehydrogenase [bacterium]|nr:hydroxyacid dehydrogenase [bacterium]
MTKIVFFDVADYEVDYLMRSCDGEFDFVLVEESLSSISNILSEWRDAEVVSCFTTSRIGKDVLKKFPNLKLLALRSVGFNHVDIDYCKKHKITVVNTPNYGNMTVAEFAFGLMLDVSRKITLAYNDLKNAIVDAKHTIGTELFGKTIGIVGLGAIGAEMARLSYGFGLKVLGYDIKEREILREKYAVSYVPFDELLRRSDFISIHAPLTKDNYHIFNMKSFEKMKPNAIIINTARGEIIDTQALYNAIVDGKIAGAGLDVLESEEILTDPDYLVDVGRMKVNALQKIVLNNSLLKLDNVIVTPHIAYDTKEAIDRILSLTMANIYAFENGVVQNKVV